MASEKLSTIAGGSGSIKLSPDLTFPEDKVNGAVKKEVIVNPAGSLTTALSLTGKFAIPYLILSTLTVDDLNTVKLTIDGVVIWNTSVTSNSASEIYIGFVNAQSTDVVVTCESSFLFEIQTTADTSVTVGYIARPIL